jgi:hypothetical protein
MRKYSTREISLQRPGHPANLITHCVRTPHQPPLARYAGASQPPPREITFFSIIFRRVCVCVCVRARERAPPRGREHSCPLHLLSAFICCSRNSWGCPSPPACWPTPLTCLPAYRPASNMPAYLPLSLCSAHTYAPRPAPNTTPAPCARQPLPP